jgi:succinate dehydrogenase / fumarate reductase cytochrome b subunit
MAEAAGRHRPEFRNLQLTQLFRYRLPLAGFVSILHRISGLLLFLIGIPFLLYLLQQSLISELSFSMFSSLVTHWFAKLVLLALIWAFVHHLLAGLRFLLLDVHLGTSKAASRLSARIVLVAAIVLTIALALKLFGAF